MPPQPSRPERAVEGPSPGARSERFLRRRVEPRRASGRAKALRLLWLLPIVFATLFLSVRQELQAQQLQKRIAAGKTEAELLKQRVQQLRHLLALETEFGRIEPCARAMGLRPAHTGQVLAMLPDAPGREDAAISSGAAGWLLSGMVDLLGPTVAQAEDRSPSRTVAQAEDRLLPASATPTAPTAAAPRPGGAGR